MCEQAQLNSIRNEGRDEQEVLNLQAVVNCQLALYRKASELHKTAERLEHLKNQIYRGTEEAGEVAVAAARAMTEIAFGGR